MRRKISEIAEVRSGYQHRRANEDLGDGSHRIIQVKDVDREGRFAGRFSVAAEYRLWAGDLDRVTPKGGAEAYRVKEGDVLFLSRGSRFLAIPMVRPYVEPFPESWEEVIAAHFFYILRPKEVVSAEYLAWVLNEGRTQRAMEGVTQGTGVKMLALRFFGDLEVDVPPRNIQEKITELDLLCARERRLAGEIESRRRDLVEAVCAKAAAFESLNHQEAL